MICSKKNHGMRLWMMTAICLFSCSFAAFAGIPHYSQLDSGAIDRANVCVQSHGESAEVAIDACTWAMQSGLWQGKDLSWAYQNRAIEYVSIKRFDLAIQDLDTAINLNPKDGNALTWRGIAYYSMGNYEPAIDNYNQALELQPDNADTYGDRAAVYLALGQYARAIDDYNRALSLDPKAIDFLNGRGAAYRNLGNYQQAITDYSKIIEHDPDSVSALLNRCMARAYWGQELDIALADCSHALRISPGELDVLAKRGLVYLRMGNYPAAIADENACLAAGPNWGMALYIRGLAEVKAGVSDQGKTDMARAEVLDPSLAATLSVFGPNH
ncbi:MAG: tetratricopeptide repeat protein [Rhizomicrobium sp.]